MKKEKSLVALSGKLCVGKTTLAEGLKKDLGYEAASIGAPIKKTAALLIEDPALLRSYLNARFKEQGKANQLYQMLIDIYQEKFQNAAFEKHQDGYYIKNQAYRDLTQTVATLAREKFGKEIWVRFLAEEAFQLAKEGKAFVCDDLRLDKEKEVFESYGFIIIRLDASKEAQRRRIQSAGYGEISEAQLSHITEIDLDDATFDFRLDTTHLSIDEVRKDVYQFLEKKNEDKHEEIYFGRQGKELL